MADLPGRDNLFTSESFAFQASGRRQIDLIDKDICQGF